MRHTERTALIALKLELGILARMMGQRAISADANFDDVG